MQVTHYNLKNSSVLLLLVFFSHQVLANYWNCNEVSSLIGAKEAIESHSSKIKLISSAENDKRPSKDDPFIVVGHFDGSGSINQSTFHDTTSFAIAMSKALDHPCIDHAQWRKAEYLDMASAWAPEDLEFVLKQVLGTKESPGRTGDSKSVLVKLDGFDIDDPEKGISQRKYQRGVTTSEIIFILENQHYFDHTRWFLNGKELTKDELNEKFSKHFPDRFK